MAACRHPDIQRFGEIRCCLSCGEAVFESTPEPPATLVPSLHYQYKPLRRGLGHEIRLIVLFAGDSDDLSCDITTVNLADQPSYEAVSYTWANSNGDVSLTSSIQCRGATVAITKNCEAALRRLRLQGRNRRLWVDAICINQNDTEEKNHQVRLMSTIYSNAAQVLSYLGVESPQITRRLRAVITFLQDRSSTPSPDPSKKDDLLTFLALPYFDRVWIMQEIGLAQLVTLIIGEYEIRWTGDTISKMLAMCSQLDLKPPSVLRWTPSSRPEEQNDILAVLSKSRNCSARDPRDKVYALLGLTDLKLSSQFPVDYSLTHLEVYAKLAIYCIDKLGRFDVLQHCQHVSDPDWHRTNTRRIPSWIPQWDFKDAYEPLPPQFTAIEKQHFASSWHMVPTNPGAWLRNELPLQLLLERITTDFASDPEYYSADPHLSTSTCREQVRRWSELESVHNPASSLSAADDEHLAQQIVHRQSSNFSYAILEREIFSRDHPAIVRAAQRSTDGVFLTPQTLPLLKLRAHRLDTITRLIGPMSKQRAPTIPQTAWSAFGVADCEKCSIPANAPALSSAASRAAFWWQRKALLSKVEALGAGSTIFATVHSVGFTHARCLVGDSVWALHGADVPFVLRERDGHYELVGDCNLHRAGQPFRCEHCGAVAKPWPMQTHVLDIW